MEQISKEKKQYFSNSLIEKKNPQVYFFLYIGALI